MKIMKIKRLRRIFILDSNIKCAEAEMCKEIAELDGDGLPKLLPKDGGNRRVDSKNYLQFILN